MVRTLGNEERSKPHTFHEHPDFDSFTRHGYRNPITDKCEATWTLPCRTSGIYIQQFRPLPLVLRLNRHLNEYSRVWERIFTHIASPCTQDPILPQRDDTRVMIHPSYSQHLHIMSQLRNLLPRSASPYPYALVITYIDRSSAISNRLIVR